MKNLRKTFIYTLTALMIASMILTGCASNDQVGGKQTEKPGGNDGITPVKVKMNLTVLRHEHPSQPLNSNAPALKQIEKVTGVKIDLQGVPLSDYETKKKTLISTNRIPDVIYVNLMDLQDYAHTGMFLDLTPYLDKMQNFKKAMEKNPEVNKVKVDGKLYGFPNLDRTDMYYGQLPMIRSDVLKDLNLPMPTSFEELYQTLKKMKAANPNSYPWTMRWGTSGNVPFLGYAFGTGYATYYEPSKDKYQFGPLYPEFKNLLTYLKQMYDEKLLDPNYATNTAQQWQENLSSGKSLFFYDNNSFAVNFNRALQQKNPNAKFDAIPVMKNDSGQRRNFRYPSGHLKEFYAISSKVKNPEKVVEFFDWLYSEEGADITNYGVPGEHFTRTKDGVKLNQKLVDQFKDKQEPTWGLLSYLGTGFQGFSLYSDQTIFQDTSQDMITWGDLVKKQADQGLFQTNPLDPPFKSDETEKLKQLKTKVETVASQNMDKFIMGDRPLSDYDNFVKELTDAGAKEIEKIYNNAYERFKTEK